VLGTGAQFFKAGPATIGVQSLDDTQLQLTQIDASPGNLHQEQLRDAWQGCEPERDEGLWQVGKDQEYTCGEGEFRDGFTFQHQGLQSHIVERQGPLLDYQHGC
jgi:hypothetical protein